MYNGIGLPTPRGSGTNGYVQRNLSALRHKKERADGRPEDELRKLEASLAKKPNRDILDHERKRKVELKCLELSELMEEQGYTESEIQEKVATFRMMLLEKDVALGKEGEQPDQKPTVTETHQLAEANEKKNERLRAAFGISDSYVDGSSFDPSRRAKEAPPEPPQPPSAVAAPVAVAARESSSSPSPSPKQKKKKKKKDRGRSESRSGERKKAKKKKHRSESEAKKRKHRSPSPKPKHKSKEKKRKRSPSEAASQKSRRERSSSPAASSSSSASSRSRSRSATAPKAPRRQPPTATPRRRSRPPPSSRR